MAPLLQLGLKFHNYGLFEVTQRQISFIELTPGIAHDTVCLKPIRLLLTSEDCFIGKVVSSKDQ